MEDTQSTTSWWRMAWNTLFAKGPSPWLNPKSLLYYTAMTFWGWKNLVLALCAGALTALIVLTGWDWDATKSELRTTSNTALVELLAKLHLQLAPLCRFL